MSTDDSNEDEPHGNEGAIDANTSEEEDSGRVRVSVKQRGWVMHWPLYHPKEVCLHLMSGRNTALLDS